MEPDNVLPEGLEYRPLWQQWMNALACIIMIVSISLIGARYIYQAFFTGVG